jgi:hypothetical protein
MMRRFALVAVLVVLIAAGALWALALAALWLLGPTVVIVGETPKCYRIATITPSPVYLPRGRVLGPGGSVLVPKYTVTRRNGDA